MAALPPTKQHDILNTWTSVGSISPHGSITASNTMVQPTMHTIQGEMIMARYVMGDMEFSAKPMQANEVKKRLVSMLAEKLYESDRIEFTKSENHYDMSHTFTARIYAVPDSQVRILRTLHK